MITIPPNIEDQVLRKWLFSVYQDLIGQDSDTFQPFYLRNKPYIPSLIQRLGTETYVYSLVSLGGGVALAGTGTTGQIYKSTDSGATWSLIQRLGTETYVLSLVSLGGGVALAGTGTTGQIYRYL